MPRTTFVPATSDLLCNPRRDHLIAASGWLCKAWHRTQLLENTQTPRLAGPRDFTNYQSCCFSIHQTLSNRSDFFFPLSRKPKVNKNWFSLLLRGKDLLRKLAAHFSIIINPEGTAIPDLNWPCYGNVGELIQQFCWEMILWDKKRRESQDLNLIRHYSLGTTQKVREAASRGRERQPERHRGLLLKSASQLIYVISDGSRTLHISAVHAQEIIYSRTHLVS